jgi:hypothetical protein
VEAQQGLVAETQLPDRLAAHYLAELYTWKERCYCQIRHPYYTINEGMSKLALATLFSFCYNWARSGLNLLVKSTMIADQCCRRQFNGCLKSSQALVLSGGGGRGAYHIGVLRFLEEHEWHPDIIVGTSIGAVNGAA